jgi:hypothetical protein
MATKLPKVKRPYIVKELIYTAQGTRTRRVKARSFQALEDAVLGKTRIWNHGPEKMPSIAKSSCLFLLCKCITLDFQPCAHNIPRTHLNNNTPKQWLSTSGGSPFPFQDLKNPYEKINLRK